MRLGLLNMMPDKALRVTERQFAQLCGLAGIDDLVGFGVPGVPRGPDVTEHVAGRYRPATELGVAGLDLLVISGANVADPRLPLQPFYEPLCRVFADVRSTGLPTLFSCLATHALLEAEHGEIRRPVAPKVWGVFDHLCRQPDHPLVAGLSAPVPVPHSRHNQLDGDQFARAGYTVLLDSPQVGPHLAVSADGRRLLLQGHPEYEAISLLKEYKREFTRWRSGERSDFPPRPVGYLTPEAAAVLARHEKDCAETGTAPDLPESRVAPLLTEPWAGPARRIIGNWLASLGLVG